VKHNDIWKQETPWYSLCITSGCHHWQPCCTLLRRWNKKNRILLRSTIL